MSYVIPNTTTELLGFYGTAPVSQPTAAAQAAITDNSGGTASPTGGVTAVAATSTVIIPVTMASLANSQTYKIAIPYAFTVTAALLRMGAPVTTSAKAATLTTQIAGAACTGGVISASGTYATGTTQAGTSITAANTGTAGQTLEIAVSSVTAFTEGSGWIEFTVTNNSMANALATAIALPNALRSAFVTLGIIKGA